MRCKKNDNINNTFSSQNCGGKFTNYFTCNARFFILLQKKSTLHCEKLE